MIPKYYYTYLCSLLLINISLSAQQVVMTELPTQKLLPVANIHRIFQDSEGYMWYGTEGGGLCRDNGYQIDIFRSDRNTPHLLSSNFVVCIAEDNKQHIWFGTGSGLYRLNKANYQITEVTEEGLRHQHIDALLATRNGTVWASGKGVIYRYSSNGEKIKSYPSLYRGDKKNVADIYEDSHHNIWITQWNGGILRYNARTDEMDSVQWTYDVSPTQIVEDTSNHCFWIGTWGKGVVRLTPSKLKNNENTETTNTYELQPSSFSESTQNIHKAQILSVLSDSRQGLLWVVTMDNLYAYRVVENHLVPFSTESFLPKNKKILDRMIEDRSGNIWVAGYSPHSFILSFDRDRIERYPTPAMTARTGYPVMADRTVQEGEYYWIWQGRTGLSLYHPASELISFSSDSPTKTDHYHIAKHIEKCRTKEGIWAIGQDAQLLHIVHRDMQMKLAKCIRISDARQISTFYEDDRGNIWIGTENALYQYLLSEQILKKIAGNTGTINKITVAQNGIIYCTTESHKLLCITKKGKVSVIEKGESYSSIVVTPDGTLWVATLQGNVYRYSTKKQKLVQENNACHMNGDAVKAMITDRLGHLWILADQYVKEYNPRNKSFRILHNSDRFIHVDYFLSIDTMEDGNVCLGGIGAFCLVTPSSELDQTPDSIHPVISSLKIDRAPTMTATNGQQLELSPYNTNLEVSFSTLEHLYAKRISYAYRLIGRDHEWNYLPSGSNIVSFAKLPKGHYTLEVMATDIHGRWGQPVPCLLINRRPAWYETWWAYTLYTIIILTVSTILLRIYFKRLRQKQKEQTEQLLAQARFQFLTNITSSALDEEFLNKAIALVEKNIDNCDYSVELFSDDMCMSRMNLYRKLQSITGQKPTEFIRSIRLKKAAQLLTDTELSIIEIAERVGFSTPSYFSKCFKEMFEVLPTQYRG